MIVKKGEVKNLDQTWVYDKSEQKDEVLIKAVVESGGRLEAKGKIVVEKGVFGVDVFLRYKVLLLGKGAFATVDPILEIKSNDVKAGHAASIGRVDEDQIFYLMSRGLAREESVKLIVDAFLNE